VSPDLEAVLALQAEDTIVAQLNEKLRKLDSQLIALDAERKHLEDSLARAKSTAEQEEKKRRELSIKVEDHKAMQERNLATLDVVRKPKEATAAMAQVDMLKKVLSEEETDLHSLSLRVHDVHHAIDGQQKLLGELDLRQMEQREAHAKERAVIEKELSAAREIRNERATHVSKGILLKYERILSRNTSNVLYPLRGQACGRCDTAIPMQRRNAIAAGRAIDVCEACGVLLYATG
jgi:predicted  nucleic acid-binding Zn-ribbon protein